MLQEIRQMSEFYERVIYRWLLIETPGVVTP
jgi:hypothetical protein